jgi:hypothetical protein
MMSLAGTTMTNTSIMFLGQGMKMSTMQSIRKCMETRFMRKKNKLQNNIKYRMKTTFQRQTKRKKNRNQNSLKLRVIVIN